MISEHYLLEWGQIYLTHFGAWVSFALAVTVHKNGLPELKSIPKMVLSAIVLASIVAVFSSHSHNHFLQHFINK